MQGQMEMGSEFSGLVKVPEATLRAGKAPEPPEAVSDAQNMHYGSTGGLHGQSSPHTCSVSS